MFWRVRSIKRSTRASSSMGSNGLEMYSSAPSLKPVRRSLMAVRLVTMMMGIRQVPGSCRSLWQTSNPCILGSRTSKRITSGRSVRALARASSPSMATITWYFSDSNMCWRKSTKSRSSSTRSTLALSTPIKISSYSDLYVR